MRAELVSLHAVLGLMDGLLQLRLSSVQSRFPFEVMLIIELFGRTQLHEALHFSDLFRI